MDETNTFPYSVFTADDAGMWWTHRARTESRDDALSIGTDLSKSHPYVKVENSYFEGGVV